jgi:hypothetical protein
LSAVSLIGAGIAGWFAISKGGEAEAAKKLATSLETKVKDLETKVVGVSEQKVQELIDTALTGKLDADGVKALFATVLQNHPNKTEITADIAAAVADKANTTAIDALAQKLESAKLTKTQEENVKELLRIFVAGQLSKPQLAEVNDLIRQATQGDISIAEFYNLESLVGEHTEKFRTLLQEVGGKTVSNPDIFNLFKAPTTLAKDTEAGFKSAVRAYLNDVEGTADSHSITLIKAGLDAIENPGDLLRLKADLPSTLDKNNEVDLYHSQLRNLTNSLDLIETIFNGEDVELAYTKRTPKEILDVITTKAQAVVKAAHAENLEDVKTAQTQLVAELQQQFGRSHTEKFEAEYRGAILSFDRPTEGFAHPWVEGHMKDEIQTIRDPQQRLDALSKMFLDEKGGLSGKDPENLNIHKDTNLLANVVLRNLEDALVDAYPKHVQKTRNRLSVKDDIKMSGDELNALDNLTRTLNKFQKAFQPIDRERHYGSDLLAVKSEDEIKLLDPQDKFGYDMVQARLKGNTAEIETTTQKMYDLLREHLGALKNAEAKAAEAALNFLNIPGLLDGKSVRLTLLDKMGYGGYGSMAEPSFNQKIAEQVALIFTETEQQTKVNDALLALFSAQQGEDLPKLDAVQQLSNSRDVIQVFQEGIGTLLSSEGKPANDAVQAEAQKIIAVIQKGLPSTQAS